RIVLDFLCLGLIPFIKELCNLFKIFAVNQCFMCFGNHKPLIPWALCMCGSVSDALITAIVYGIPHINWIVQDGLHRSDRPCCMKASAFIFIMSSLRPMPRGRNSLTLIAPERNFCIAHT